MSSGAIHDTETTEIRAGVERLDAVRLRLVASFDTQSAGSHAESVYRRAGSAVAGLADVDLDALDAVELRAWLEGVEELRRTVESAAVAAAGRIDRSNPFRDQAFFSTKTAVKHMCRLSGPEAHRRVQTARLHAALPTWGRPGPTVASVSPSRN